MSKPKLYYFDNNATTAVAPEVVEAMMPFWTQQWGNPSSGYQFGRQTVRAIDLAREQVAALIHAEPGEIVFTSCGTESNNTAIHSGLLLQPEKRHVLMTAVEHSANLNYATFLQRLGYEITLLPVDTDGCLDLHLVDQSIRKDTAMVSIMWANNETGILFPIEEIAAICRSKGVSFHTDAVQAAGKVRIDVREMDLDYLSLSAHKLHAPKGIGLLYVNRRSKFHPYIFGGHQEHGRRAGTENVAYIAGFGKAAELASARMHDENSRVRTMRDRLEKTLLATVPGSARNGAAEPRLPNTSNLGFDRVEAEAILLALDQLGICVSSGSACTTGSLKPSHVLTAMGLNPVRAKGCLRFSLGVYNTDQEVDYLLEHLPGILARLRALTPADEERTDAVGMTAPWKVNPGIAPAEPPFKGPPPQDRVSA